MKMNYKTPCKIGANICFKNTTYEFVHEYNNGYFWVVILQLLEIDKRVDIFLSTSYFFYNEFLYVHA